MDERFKAMDLAQKVAKGLGMNPVPDALPLALPDVATPEVLKSPSLSLLHRPGNGSLAGRKVAILVAPGKLPQHLTAAFDASP